jgi:murein DD-endopeptidase MepM/ murein hydrolase activator NlpD
MAGVRSGRIVSALAAIAFLCAVTGSILAIEWPVSPIVLTGTFGENEDSHFDGGIDLGGGERDVYPMLPGELLFYHEEGEDPLDLPTGLGSFVVIDHDKGLRSLYAHLKAGSIPVETTTFTQTTALGVTGDTGSSYGTRLHFAIIDREFNQVVNPLLLLNPIVDTKKPVIEG